MTAVGVCIGCRIGHYGDFRGKMSDEDDPEDELGLLVVRV